MYGAKNAVAKQALKDITPIVAGVQSGTAKIGVAIAEKRKRQKEDSEKKIEPFKEVLLKNATLRPELTSRLEDLQDEYYKNLKTSEALLVGKDKKSAAVERNNEIAGILKTYETQIASVDLSKKENIDVSNANSLTAQVNDVIRKDKTLADNVIVKDDGLYFLDANGVEQSLDKYTPPMAVYQTGIDESVKLFSTIQKAGSTGVPYEGAIEQQVESNMNNMLKADNAMSLLFDDIGTFNWATENMTQYFPENSGVERGDNGEITIVNEDLHAANVEELKSMYEKDPEAFKAEFKKDYIESAKKQYDIADTARKDALRAKIDAEATGTKPSYAQRLKFENFVTSFNSGEDIIGENNIFVRNNKGGYEVYTKGRQPVLNPPTTGKDGVAIKGSQQTITLEDLISRATDLGLPQEYVDLLKEKTTKTKETFPAYKYNPTTGNFKKGGLPE
jgi:hypothetical protein